LRPTFLLFPAQISRHQPQCFQSTLYWVRQATKSVDFQDGDTGNSATIHGGSGDDTVTLAGSRSDYSVRHHHGYSTYTDRDGNTIRVAGDVEHVRFEGRNAA
jgi:hypothetical protein